VSLGVIESTELLVDNDGECEKLLILLMSVLINLCEDLTDINDTDNCKRTPLHCAAFWGKTDCVNLLLEHPQTVIDAQVG